MSYGRRPYYIYRGEYDDGEDYFCFMDQAVIVEGGQTWATIKYDAMAQFVASMWMRDNSDISLVSGELKDLIERGLEVRNEPAS